MAQSHFLSLKDWSREEIELLFEEAAAIKSNPEGYSTSLAGKSLAMIFQKPSTRTRVSFEVGMFQLGGQALFLGASDIQLHRGETIADTARVLSRYVHGIMARVFLHQDILDLARHGSVPVINGLSDLLHPCQALADYFTLRERRGDLTGLKMAYVGDGNNVAHELMFGAVKLGMQFSIGCPTGYEPNPLIYKSAVREAQRLGSPLPEVTSDPMQAVAGADAVYTDVWTSMGQEKEAKKRLADFQGFQVTPEMMAVAPDAIFMHCLPAHRGEEVAADVIDGPQSAVFDEAENRLHVQKAILVTLMGDHDESDAASRDGSASSPRHDAQRADDLVPRDVVVDRDPADGRGQDERHAPGLRLLVPGERLEHLRRREVGDPRPRPDVVHGRGDRVEGRLRQQAAPARDEGRADRPPAHGLAVREAAVARHRLERVADRVAEVQHAAQPALALVLLHHLGLDPAGRGDRVLHGHPVPAAQARRGLADRGEERAVAEDRALEDLVGARAELRGPAASRGTRGR